MKKIILVAALFIAHRTALAGGFVSSTIANEWDLTLSTTPGVGHFISSKARGFGGERDLPRGVSFYNTCDNVILYLNYLVSGRVKKIKIETSQGSTYSNYVGRGQGSDAYEGRKAWNLIKYSKWAKISYSEGNERFEISLDMRHLPKYIKLVDGECY